MYDHKGHYRSLDVTVLHILGRRFQVAEQNLVLRPSKVDEMASIEYTPNKRVAWKESIDATPQTPGQTHLG
jgi:hypothetical protein